jgi:DNA-directed RNA polymerase subunit RPC12/RpoP
MKYPRPNTKFKVKCVVCGKKTTHDVSPYMTYVQCPHCHGYTNI